MLFAKPFEKGFAEFNIARSAASKHQIPEQKDFGSISDDLVRLINC